METKTSINSLGQRFNSLRQPICGYDRGIGYTVCLLPSGYKTNHDKSGQCYLHPGVSGGIEIRNDGIDPRMSSVWDRGDGDGSSLVTVTDGDIVESDDEDHHNVSTSPLVIIPSRPALNPKSYAPNISSPRLRELVEHEESVGNLDDMDSLVALLRGTIAFQCQFLGIGIEFNDLGIPVVNPDTILSVDVSFNVMNRLFVNISRLTEIIKRKYEVTTLAQSLFTHDRVTTYIGEITSVIDAVLRDTCESCGFEHGLRGKVLDALVKIGDI